ncbi:hypothetical protein QFC20_005799 [Naganishia adeliensis]|uniref:Uncharacterized protein n=1 Tax=Naganishia adeliensis TaxID=92952 RepID=A0ACC2VK52_9TREE|nr:hypothetical protein QFC20_005799 [Naganishia adeliensis]
MTLLGVAADDPKVGVTRFKNLPSKLFYFEDTTTILMHGPVSSTVHISQDEGLTWHPAPNVPPGTAIRLIQHPFNNDMAFIIGRHGEHWATYNRGASWGSWGFAEGTEGREASLSSAEVMGFHAGETDWVLFQVKACEDTGWGLGTCWDETYYTQDAFPKHSTHPTPTRAYSASHSTPPTKAPLAAGTASSESRLYTSDSWFLDGKKFVDLGIGKRAAGVVGLGTVSKYIVVALKSPTTDLLVTRSGSGDPMHLYISTDGASWSLARFPHDALPTLKENAYTVVESTTHSLAIDILTDPAADIGTLFVSSADGIFFVQALEGTNRNDYGIVDYEGITGLEGVGLANVVANREEVVGWGEEKKLRSLMTFDDGSSWAPIRAPEKQINGDSYPCDVSDTSTCSLHLHSVSSPHNFGKVFSSPAPGFIMGVGSVGDTLEPYEDGDTYVSSDAGVTWRMAQQGAHKYEIGDQGSILVIIDDEDRTDHVHYSYDFGETWERLNLGVTLRALLLTTVPDSTSQKFMILGTLGRGDASDEGRHAVVYLDFAPLQQRKCGEKDLEHWYVRPPTGRDCVLGHKQWYRRRKPEAKCYVGNKFNEEIGHEEDCECADEDYECDFNYVLADGECVSRGLETVPVGQCTREGQTYMGSSGYRKIPGDTCKNGLEKDAPVRKDCSLARPEDGKASHVVHSFDSYVVNQQYFGQGTTVLLQLADDSVWQSSNEGFSWKRLYEQDHFLTIIMHAHSSDRAYLVTDTRKMYYTTDTGRTWSTIQAPADPNPFNIEMLDFHPTRSDWLIFTGAADCGNTLSQKCRAIAYYSTDNGRRWRKLEEYVRTCSWARDARLKIDEREIICESYRDKKGSQRSADYNPLQLVAGQQFYSKKTKLFDSVVGFATFSEYLIVAELDEASGTLRLQVSLDGLHFAQGQFPPSMKIDNRAYTILESSTDSVFLHVTMNDKPGAEWGSIFKSNSNGTYYSLAVEHVNRDIRGYTDFEKMIGLDGIALINVVANPDAAGVSGNKKLKTLITHNDGATWKPMSPPAKDSLGQEYECTATSCGVNVWGYTSRRDFRATYSSPSAVGLMMAVGNVGETLAPYSDCDVFLTRDGGKVWEEVHKDAHLWEFGDSGSVLVLVNDEGPTDHVIYSTDEGLSWNEYTFEKRLRVASIQTVPTDTSRKFMLIGTVPGETEKSVIVHLDFSQIAQRKCVLNVDDPQHDDMELWSPSESRDDQCLFGRQTSTDASQTLYHRRIRDRNCYIGETLEHPRTVVKNCTCVPSDFECQFNHYRDASDKCVLVQGAVALPKDTSEEQCVGFEPYWYERTAYRKIPYSSCEGGARPDRGARHSCPGLVGGGRGVVAFFYWLLVLLVAGGAASGVAYLLYTRRERGAIRLSEHRAFGGSSGALSTLASVPYYMLGVASAAAAWMQKQIPFIRGLFPGGRNTYRPIDEDAEILNAYEED